MAVGRRAHDSRRRYFVFDATPLQRGVVEVSRGEYEVVLAKEQRETLPVFAVIFVGFACAVFTAGEVRRADVRGGAGRSV